MNWKSIMLCFGIATSLVACKNNEGDLKQAQHQIDSLKRQHDIDSAILANNKNIDSINKANASQNLSLSDLFNKLKPSVFLVKVVDIEGETLLGSAFLINNQNGICISNQHVFQDFDYGVLKDYNNVEHQITEILQSSEDNDFVIFKIENTKNLTPVQITTKQSSIGDECFAIGNPKGLEQTLSTGIVSGYREDNKLIQTTTSITHGSSGGPLFNTKGQVIGITTMGYEGTGNLNFAINIQNIPLKKYGAFIENATTTSTATASNSLPNVIQQFLMAEQNKDINAIFNCFAYPMQRYWETTNPTREKLEKQYTSRWSKMGATQNEIKAVNKINENTYELTLDFSFYSLKDNITKVVKDTKVRYELNNEGKIVSVYGVK